jgi:Na+/serine symporter
MEFNDLNNIGLRNMIIYFSFCIVYILMVYKMGTEFSAYQFAMFFSFTFIIQLALNYSTDSIICKTPNGFNTFLNTFIPWIFILGLGQLFITIFPGWLRIFSNTIGMYIAYEKYADDINRILANSTQEVKNSTSEGKAILLEALNKPKMILNEVDIIGKEPAEIDTMYERLTVMFKELFKPDAKDKIIDIIKHKNMIGYTIWHILLGVITVMVSTNSTITSNCGFNS